MKVTSQAAGSSNMYEENSKAATIVTTNGTSIKSATKPHKQISDTQLTVLCHRLSERWPNT